MRKVYIVIIGTDTHGISISDMVEGNRDQSDIMTFDDVISADLAQLKEEIGILPEDIEITITSYAGEKDLPQSLLQMIFADGKSAFDEAMRKRGYRREKTSLYHTYSSLWV